MLERLKNTVGDVAETIKRAFAGPKVYSANQYFLGTPTCKAMTLPTTNSKTEILSLSANYSVVSLILSATVSVQDIKFVAHAQSDSGGTFNAGAKLVNVQLAWPDVVKSAGIPQLNSPRVNGCVEIHSAFTTISYAFPPFSLKHEKNHRIIPTIEAARCTTSLKAILARPMRIRPENTDKIPRPLWMRYTLQLLKETNENIRNLEIIGLFSIPKKGVHSLRHDHATGSLMVTLGAEAQNSEYCKLMLARKKNKPVIVRCIVQD